MVLELDGVVITVSPYICQWDFPRDFPTLFSLYGRPWVQEILCVGRYVTGPCKMVVKMRLMCVFYAATSTPPHFLVGVKKIVAPNVLTHTLMGTKLFIKHNKCYIPCVP